MFKMAMVSFRTSRDVKETLDRIGRETQRSRSALIEEILKKFLTEKKLKEAVADGADAQEIKSAYQEGPAVLEDGNHIVLGGVRVAVPKDFPIKIRFDEKAGIFQLEFPAEDGTNLERSHLKLTGS